VNDELNQKAAWYYPRPKSEAAHIKNHIAFWKGVEIIKSLKILIILGFSSHFILRLSSHYLSVI